MKIIEGWKLIANDINSNQNKHFIQYYFNFDYSKKVKFTHIFTEYMLNKGYISTNYMFVSYAHTNDAIDKYLKICDQVFKKIKKT